MNFNNEERFLPHKQQQCRKYSLGLLYMILFEAHSRHTQILWTDCKQAKLKKYRVKTKRKIVHIQQNFDCIINSLQNVVAEIAS